MKIPSPLNAEKVSSSLSSSLTEVIISLLEQMSSAKNAVDNSL